MTHEQRVEALQSAVQAFVDEIPGASAVFTYPDAEAALESIGLANRAEPVDYANV